MPEWIEDWSNEGERYSLRLPDSPDETSRTEYQMSCSHQEGWDDLGIIVRKLGLSRRSGCGSSIDARQSDCRRSSTHSLWNWFSESFQRNFQKVTLSGVHDSSSFVHNFQWRESCYFRHYWEVQGLVLAGSFLFVLFNQVSQFLRLLRSCRILRNRTFSSSGQELLLFRAVKKPSSQCRPVSFFMWYSIPWDYSHGGIKTDERME